MAQEQMAPPPEGAQPQEGGDPAEAVMTVVQTVDEGLGMLNEIASQLPIGDGSKKKLAQVQQAFQQVITEIMQGGGAPQESQMQPSQAPMEQGAGGQPASPSVRV